MSTVPAELKYSKSHEWVQDNGDGIATIGITDHAQEALGDLVFVELPEVGRTLAVEEACAVVESVKAASDIYSPLSGEVVEVNTDLVDAPETINQDPYSAGWILKLRLADPGELGTLLDAEAYSQIADEH